MDFSHPVCCLYASMAQRIPEPFIWRCDNSRCDPRTLSLGKPDCWRVSDRTLSMATCRITHLLQCILALCGRRIVHADPGYRVNGQAFKYNNYAVGAGLAKSEALVAAILGMLFFGTQLTVLGWLGVVIGGVGVFMLSSHGGFKQLSLPTVLLGLSSGSAFALTSLWVREASLASQLPFPYSAAWVLLLVISLQTLCLVGYLLIKEIDLVQALATPEVSHADQCEQLLRLDRLV